MILPGQTIGRRSSETHGPDGPRSPSTGLGPLGDRADILSQVVVNFLLLQVSEGCVVILSGASLRAESKDP